jgi:hypothetical protein
MNGMFHGLAKNLLRFLMKNVFYELIHLELLINYCSVTALNS